MCQVLERVYNKGSSGIKCVMTSWLQVTLGWKRNLQTFFSACPWRHGWPCPRAQPHSCSQSPYPGDHRRRCSCAGTLLGPWSGRRVTGSADGFRHTCCAQGRLRPPCHPPAATVLLHGVELRWNYVMQPNSEVKMQWRFRVKCLEFIHCHIVALIPHYGGNKYPFAVPA